jgi:hypothetical protein
MLKCYAVCHDAEDNLAHACEHQILQTIADEVCLEFEPGFAGNSYLGVPSDENLKQTVEARMKQNRLEFQVVTRIAY